MSAPDPPTGSTQGQSPLSEAVEQATDAARRWFDEIADFAKHEADQLSSGNYGLSDLVTGQVSPMRIWVRNTILTADVLSNNLALLSYARPGAPPLLRTTNVRVGIPANASVKLAASDMVGRLLAYRIPSSNIRLVPEEPAIETQERHIGVKIEVDCLRAPNDIYEGRLYCADGTVSVPFLVALDELGEPLP